jgi:uncharacterized protein
MTGRYGEDARARALLDRLVDVHKALKGSVILPLRGTSLKDVAPWLGFHWQGATQSADESMLEYLAYLADGQPGRLTQIVQYNADDCTALVTVRDWLASLPAGEG